MPSSGGMSTERLYNLRNNAPILLFPFSHQGDVYGCCLFPTSAADLVFPRVMSETYCQLQFCSHHHVTEMRIGLSSSAAKPLKGKQTNEAMGLLFEMMGEEIQI